MAAPAGLTLAKPIAIATKMNIANARILFMLFSLFSFGCRPEFKFPGGTLADKIVGSLPVGVSDNLPKVYHQENRFVRSFREAVSSPVTVL
jgi:hypothetical protein